VQQIINEQEAATGTKPAKTIAQREEVVSQPTDPVSAIESVEIPQSYAPANFEEPVTTQAPVSTSTTTPALSTQFGTAQGWNVETFTASNGTQYPVFKKGNEIVVSDEIFFNKDSPTGQELINRVQDAKNQGYRVGLTVSPYALTSGAASTQMILNEIDRSGVDFVAVDPYLMPGSPYTPEQGIRFVQDSSAALQPRGVELKVVTQGFAQPGQEAQVKDYNQRLASIAGIGEIINFGLEDAPDLRESGFVSVEPTQKQITTPQRVTSTDLAGETEAVTGVTPSRDFREPRTVAEDFLMAVDPSFSQKLFKPGSEDRYTGTFVKTFKSVDGRLIPAEATPE
ncbi:MAG: hypothetical protein EBT26_11805, partial [Microbacteriaceae bacterium]|nr:hypothetical protein [Microbacteriaceae bacterium]NBS62699.1 hypothetical protein [Microbacteriaceae bacterium]